MNEHTGEQFGNYRLLQHLGSGGFADVYLGEHIYLKTQAAVKVLKINLPDAKQQQVFLQETQVIAQLNHPHINQVLDSGVENNIPFVVMNHAPGGNLHQRYPVGSQVPADRVLLYIRQASLALQYAHEQKLIHRDIKPENLLLDSDGTILLSDFGISAIAYSSQAQELQKTVGVMAYMAPEQIRGKPRPSSDQYALAALAYELLSGTPLFEAPTQLEVAKMQLEVPAPLLSQKMPMLAPAVTTVLNRALAKSPNQRFATLELFTDALDAAIRFATEPAPLIETPIELTETSVSAFDIPPLRLEPERVQPRIPEKTRAPELAHAHEQQQSPQLTSQPAISRRAMLGILAGVGVLIVGGGAGIFALTRQQKPTSTVSGTVTNTKPTATPTPDPTPVPTLGQTVYTYSGHTSGVESLSWSPDSKNIVSAGLDKTVQVWEATTGKLAFSRSDYPDAFEGLGAAWAPKGDLIASNSNDQTVRLWDATSQQQTLYVGGQGALAWSPDGQYLAVASVWGYGRVRNASTGVVVASFVQQTDSQMQSGATNRIGTLAWSPDGQYLATGSDDGGIQVWHALTGQLISNFTGHINPVSYTPPGNTTTNLSSLAALNPLQPRSIGAYMVNSLAWSADSTQVASASADHTVQISDALTGKLTFTYRGHSGSVLAVAWSPDGQHLVSSDDTNVAQVWGSSGKTLFTYHGHKQAVHCVAWSPDGLLIASGSEDGSAQIWKAK